MPHYEHSPPYSPPTKATHFNWTPETPGSYTFEVQAIDRDLNYSKPAGITLEVVLPPHEEELRQTRQERERAEEQLTLISQQEAARWGISRFVGKSKVISEIVDDIRKLQRTDTTNVLILGENGAGKELIARAIHFGGTRAKALFLPVNCAAIPAGLAESYLFGHVRGGFTGAANNHKGYFEQADAGTLFFDEISVMSLELQAKLLRVLEDGLIPFAV